MGGISSECPVGAIVVPDQIIDYTHGRECTFFDGGDNPVEHIDFSYPYDETLRSALIDGAAAVEGQTLVKQGVYGVTQGPRLETAAEIRRMVNDGCTIVGMTGMPEAGLAREMEIDYACCAVVINPAAGIGDKTIDMDALYKNVETGMQSACAVIAEVV